MFRCPPPPPLRHWMRHTACAPKGFLRYHVLKLLKEKPMSGSEIMEEVKKETGGRWKPSPGSIYPLLAWLQDNGYIKELPKEETGIKRYTLTEQGEKFFKEQTKLREDLQKRLELFAPPFIRGFWPSVYPERIAEIREPIKRLVKAFIDLGTVPKEKLTEQTLKKVGQILDSTAEKIEEMSRKIREKETR